jgi:hypothetical protein
MSLCRKYLLLEKCKLLIKFLLTAHMYRATIITNFETVDKYIYIYVTLIERGGGTGPVKPGNHSTDVLKRC